MNANLKPEIVASVQRLYNDNANAKKLFDWTSSLMRDAKETRIERISNILGISRGEAVSLAKEMQAAGCGTFILGRRGSPSRFEWKYSRISLGQVATGEAEQIEDLTNPISEDEEESATSVQYANTMAINSARETLARSLGVDPGHIEIYIKV